MFPTFRGVPYRFLSHLSAIVHKLWLRIYSQTQRIINWTHWVFCHSLAPPQERWPNRLILGRNSYLVLPALMPSQTDLCISTHGNIRTISGGWIHWRQTDQRPLNLTILQLSHNHDHLTNCLNISQHHFFDTYNQIAALHCCVLYAQYHRGTFHHS